MKPVLMFLAFGGCLCTAEAQTAKIGKVNTAEYPNKHEKAIEQSVGMYQAGSFRHLQQHREEEPRYEAAVRWSVRGPRHDVTLRLDYRQSKVSVPGSEEIIFPQIRSGTRWSRFVLRGPDYASAGRVYAWKISVIADGKVLASKKSVLWSETDFSAAAAP